MKVGVLAVQGCIGPHLQMLNALGVSAVAVKNPDTLRECDRLILPGGESSTMLTILRKDSFFEELRSFAHARPVWGICAGAILLSKEVTNPVQPSLEAIPVRAHRNFYGSQLDSFKTSLAVRLTTTVRVEVDFIRAPHLEPLDTSVEILAHNDGRPVCLRQGHVLLTAFHTELGTNCALHSFFLQLPPAYELQAA